MNHNYYWVSGSGVYLCLVILAVLSSLVHENEGAIAASHSHIRNVEDRRSPSREREEDGAFSPRDKNHHPSSEGHRSEFDHEAILGV